MSTTIERSYKTRRDADLAVERLVQEYGVKRTDIFVSAAGTTNSGGTEQGGGDAETVLEPGRQDGAKGGQITVSIDLNDDGKAASIRAALDKIDQP